MNKRKVVVLSILIILIVTMLSMGVVNAGSVQKWMYAEDYGSDATIEDEWDENSKTAVYQSWEVYRVPANVDHIGLPIKKIGSPTGYLQMSIYTITGDLDEAYPDDLLYTGSMINFNDISTSYVWEYFYFNGSGTVNLPVGEYAFVIHSTTGSELDGSNYVSFKVQENADCSGTYGIYDWGWEYFFLHFDLFHSIDVNFDYTEALEYYPYEYYGGTFDSVNDQDMYSRRDYGQTFYIVETAWNVSTVTVWMQDTHGVAGTLRCEIYAHTGQFGLSGNKTGSVLFTSEDVNIDVLPDGFNPDIFEPIIFTFDPPVVLDGENFYVFYINNVEENDDLGMIYKDTSTQDYGNIIWKDSGGATTIEPTSTLLYVIAGEGYYGGDNETGWYPVNGTLSYTPNDSLLREDRIYTFTVNYTMNGLPLETEGVCQVRVDGDILSTVITESSMHEFNLMFSSTGIHTLTIGLYFPPDNQAYNVITEYYTVIPLPSEEEDDDDWEEQIIVFGTDMQSITFDILPVLIVLLFPAYALGERGGLIGFLGGLVIGTALGVQSALIPVQYAYLLALVIVMGLVFSLRSGGRVQ